jgi:hypothetical protein
MDVDVGKLPNHLKLCVMYSASIFSSNSLQRTENLRVVRFDAVPILSEKIPPTIGAVCGNCTSSFGTVMSQFINKKFRDGVSLLQKFNQEQQMMFLLISACSTQRKGKETYWCTCCPIKAQFGLSARHVHWAIKGHLGLFIASVGSVRFRSGPLRPGSALFNLSRSDLFQLRQALLGFSPICSVPVRSAPLQSDLLLLGPDLLRLSPICSSWPEMICSPRLTCSSSVQIYSSSA